MSIAGESTALDLLKEAGSVTVMARPTGAYLMHRAWGPLDSFNVRAIDDLSFEVGVSPETRRIALWTVDPPRAQGVEAVAVPVQIALERCFFQIGNVEEIVINPRRDHPGLPVEQRALEYSLSDDAPEPVTLSRLEIALLIGALESKKGAKKNLTERAQKALAANSLFEAFYLANESRKKDDSDLDAWFVEVLAASFLSLQDEALDLFEMHPKRGSAEPSVHLLDARFRLLLKQFNEARTILHTLTFNPELGDAAGCELARSYLMEQDYGRAVDAAQAALVKNPNNLEARLLRGLGTRGLAYPSGEQHGLFEAITDFEAVAKAGGFNSAEALFHCGVSLARIGRVEDAETAVRQSLLLRDRFAARDALVRLLVTQGDSKDALLELAILKAIRPDAVSELAAAVETHVAQSGDASSEPVLSGDTDEAVTAARALLKEWKLPVNGDHSDFSALDDFFDFYAPSGSFCDQLAYANLANVDRDTIAKAISLHLGSILTTGTKFELSVRPTVVISTGSGRIPVEGFVRERMALGAARDNFSSLESLLIELTSDPANRPPARLVGEWAIADGPFRDQIQLEIEWVKEVLTAKGVEIEENLHALAILDEFIDATFEAGGDPKPGAIDLTEEDAQRFLVGCGLLVGVAIESSIPCTWYQHVEANGVSLECMEFGRIFPIARIQRRVALSQVSDYGSKLTTLLLGVASSAAVHRWNSGSFTSTTEVRDYLSEQLSGVELLSEAEFDGLVAAITGTATP